MTTSSPSLTSPQDAAPFLQVTGGHPDNRPCGPAGVCGFPEGPPFTREATLFCALCDSVQLEVRVRGGPPSDAGLLPAPPQAARIDPHQLPR